ncbi:MAG: ribosome maturation factor [Bacteroidota bacterium]
MEEKITDMLEQFFAEEPDFQDCFLVDINQSSNKLEVFVDSDSAMTFDKCRRISRKLEKGYLDVEKPLGEKYILEVSSPGVSRPLKLWRQYVKNIGRTVEVHLTEGDKYTGQLTKVEPAQIELEAKVRRKEGKRKVTRVEEVEIPFDAIKKTIVKVTF